MFRKTITRLAYSPSLIEEASAYARHLRREKIKRQIGLIFIALAVIVQLLAVLSPPQSANTRSTSSFFEGGIASLNDYLAYYDRNARHIKDLLASLGVSRADIQSMHLSTLGSSSHLFEWKMTTRGLSDDSPYAFMTADGATHTAYYQSLNLHDNPSEINFPAYVGVSSSAGWFALLKNSGNLVTMNTPSGSCPDVSAPPADVPIPVSLSDIKHCDLKLIPKISARNPTASTSSTPRSAQASDRIIYTLSITNNSTRPVITPLSIGLSDVLEYSQLIDKGGATFNQESDTLMWSPITILPGTSLVRSFVIKISPVIPATAVGQAEPSSYDCVMSSTFGDTLHIPVACPFPKVIERVANDLPSTTASTNLIFAATVTIIAAYLYLRSRQLSTELRQIRHGYQHGL